ncbi:DUF1302 domain-containing protein [Pseudomonas sp. QL9]|uniref:DUF1302 domain-containing protein n=1 Tax=Pseudomonas sp. QL9 TaxID=3242725 RepID=UPI003529F8C0
MKPKVRLLLRSAWVLGASCTCHNALAYNFELGEVQGQLDSSLSLGASISLHNPEQRLMKSASGDDGRRNYEAGDVFSKLFRGRHDLELRYGDSGVFLRGSYWYDYALRDENQRFKNVEDAGRVTSNKSAGAELLDAFVYHNFAIADEPGSVRLGKQVVNWGESTFIPGGLNVINPTNLSALRRPGSEVKDGLVPVNLFYVTQNLNENVSADFFYQLDWQQTNLDNCGTFFSGNDYIPEGCTGLDVGGNLTGNAAAVRALSPFGVKLTEEGIELHRAADRDARNSGQWGLSMHWFVPALDTEFGAYAAVYHSRLPYTGSISSPYLTNTSFAGPLCGNLGLSGAACRGLLASSAGKTLAGALRMGTSSYFVEYPEDIRLYGLTFSTTLSSGTALQGELSYRPNLPLQFNGTDLVQAALGDPLRTPLLSSGALVYADNAASDGYRRKEVSQAQVTATQTFSQVMGADQLALVAEVGATYVGGLEGKYGPRYGRNSTFGPGELRDNSVCLAISSSPQNCNDEGFVTPFAWGYRARAIWSYANAIAGIDLKPGLSWSQDVKGYAPAEVSGFNEGSKAVGLSLDADFNSTYTAGLSYTNYFDGDYGTRGDRDFVSLSVGINF